MNEAEQVGFQLFRAAQPAISEQAAREMWDGKHKGVKNVWTRMGAAAIKAVRELPE